MRIKTTVAVAGLASLFLGVSAYAQEAQTTAQPGEQTSPAYGGQTYGMPSAEPQAMAMPPAEPEQKARNRWIPYGQAISVSGGVVDFTKEAAQDQTSTGGSWDARYVIGTRSWIGAEAAYVGTANSTDALGLDDSAVLVSNGAEGLLRMNVASIPYVQPFVFGGGAWQNYDLTNDDFNTSDISSGSDNVFALPFGGGLQTVMGGFMADARFTYRETWGNDIVRTGDSQGTLNTWNVSARVGFEF